MTINGKKLTPTQAALVLALLREEAQLNRLNDKLRANAILEKIGEN